MIKHVIWDWNGTIVNDAPLFVEIMNQSLDAALLPNITLDDYKNLFVFPVVDFWRKLGFKFNDKAFDKMNRRFINNYKKKIYFNRASGFYNALIGKSSWYRPNLDN